MAHEYAVGIDLGTTNTLACYLDGAKLKHVKFKGSGEMLPSILYAGKDGKVVVGNKARNLGVTDPTNMITSSKRYIGDFELNKTWNCYGKVFTPTDIATEILKEVRKQFVNQVCRKDENADIGAVITVPAYFNDGQRAETEKAGEAAGFHIMRIIEEPMAAAVEAIRESNENKKVLVVDIGGGTFDLSVLEADHEKSVYKAVALGGDQFLGGDDFDAALYEEFKKIIEYNTGLDLSSLESSGLSNEEYYGALSRVKDAAIEAKKELSEENCAETDISLGSLFSVGGKDYDFELTLSRDEFNDMVSEVYEKIFDKLNRFVKDNKNFDFKSIGSVVLAGGTCYIPYINEEITRIFGDIVNASENLSYLVAHGAAHVANSMNGGLTATGKPIVLKSIVAHSLGVRTIGGVFTKMLKKDEPCPCNFTERFTTARDNQEEIPVLVYEAGNDMENEENITKHKFRGSLLLKVKPMPKGEAKIDVTFAYNENYKLVVTVTDADNPTNTITAEISRDKADFEDTREIPLDIILCIDASGSMMGKELNDAKAASVKLATDMVDLSVHRLGIVRFESYAEVKCSLTQDKNALVNAINDIRDGGSTDMYDALQKANKEFFGDNQKVIIIVTDGYPDHQVKTINFANKLKAQNVIIKAIGAGSNFNASYLHSMVGAENTYTIENMAKLSEMFKKVMEDIALGR